MAGCSSDELLVRLLDEQIDDDSYRSIVDHIQTCLHCQERLQKITNDQAELHGIPPRLGDSMDACLNSAIASPVPPLASPSSATWPLASSQHARLAATGCSKLDFPDLPEYQILAELGHGGMGVVYKARQRSLNRLVALKMIRAGSLAKPEDLARFRVEAEAVAKLRHPNIIQIYDIGEHDGLPYFALELLEGGSLDEMLAGTPQPGERSAATLATLARAIHAAHEAGIIHRDLKPSNVLYASEGVPKITDFGLAKRLEETGQTETGQVLGSPSYIPPEQAQGLSKNVGPTADVYALGAILYETLTGRPPFKGTSPLDTVMQVLHDEPVPPSRLSPHVPRDLETICLKCLTKEPHRRYSTALALAEDLDRYLANQPVRARRTPPLEKGLKWARRRPTYSALGAVGILIAACALVAAWRSHADHAAHVRQMRAQAQGALTQARDKLLSGGAPVEELSKLVAILDPEPQLAVERFRAADLLLQANARRDEHDARDASLGRYHRFLALRSQALYDDVQDTDRSAAERIALTRGSAAQALKVFAADDTDARCQRPALPDSLTEQERDEIILGSYEMLLVLSDAVSQPLPGESTAQQARAALEILEHAAEIRPQPSQAFHLRRAEYLENSGQADLARQAHAQALRIEPDGAFDHFWLGLDQYKRGCLKPAKQHFDEALRAQPGHFWAQCLLAICDLNARPARPAEAKIHATACLQAHPEAPWLYLLRGFASCQLGADSPDSAEKESHFRDAEADYRHALDRDPSPSFRSALLSNRGLLRFHSGRQKEAIADLQEAIALNPRLMSAYVNMAQIRRQEHQFDQAIELLDRAIALKPDTAPLYRTRAQWNLDRPSPPADARARARADLSAAITRDVPGSRELAGDLAERGRLFLLDKHNQQALDDCDAALRITPNHPEVERSRVQALLELDRLDDAIAASDACLRYGPKSPELLGLRGLAKARKTDFAGAIDDYTLALATQPRVAHLHVRRGWAYLLSGAPQLALRDFEEAIALESSSADAYCGRGSALVAIGRHHEAASDVDQALRRGDSDPRTSYSAARILAQAAQAAQKEPRPRGQPEPSEVKQYQDRALALLADALEHTPSGRRASFWNNIVRGDHAFAAFRRLPEFARLARQYGAPPR
jgi:eukaryotic-like serine/threonine-protein kinase